jgi:SAM-dependent methyltransferase
MCALLVSMGGEPLQWNSRHECHSSELCYEGFDYASFFDAQDRRLLDRLERLVVSELLPRQGRRIVDLGGGFGRMTGTYAGRFEEAYLVDSAWSLLQQARQRWQDRLIVVAADIRHPPFRDGAFDAALAVRVLHHFSDPRSVIIRSARLLSQGGTLVFNYSNKRNLHRMLGVASGNREAHPFRRGIERYGPRSFGLHPKDVTVMLEEADLRVKQRRGVGIVDKMAPLLGRAAEILPPGKTLSRVPGVAKLAPSVFEAAVAATGRSCPEERTPFVCPACRGSVAGAADGKRYRCPACAAEFPLRDGIWDFRV